VRFLRERGCEEMQGFLFSRPVEPDEMAALIREGRTLSVEPRAESPICALSPDP
jgi:hypothetical protein